MLFHLGLHKTATSSLQKYFFQPEYGFNQLERSKILPIFVNKHATDLLNSKEKILINEFIKNSKKRKLYPVISHERLSGYPMSGGYDRLNIYRRLQKLDIEKKILLLIREQKSWLYSAWKQEIYAGASISLKRFLKPYSCPRMRMPITSLEYVNYSKEINLLNEIFGKENVCVLPMELIKKDFITFKDRLFSFTKLEFDIQDIDELKYVNETKSLTSIFSHKYIHRFIFKTSTSPSGLIDERYLISKIARKISKFTIDKLPEVPFKNKITKHHKALIKSIVGDYFNESNREASNLIGFDLKQLGYKTE